MSWTLKEEVLFDKKQVLSEDWKIYSYPILTFEEVPPIDIVLAHTAGVDPVEYRLRFLKDKRAREVLIAAAEKFGWNGWSKTKGRGRGIGFARYKNFAALTAVALEVEVNRDNGRIRLVRAVAANDSGQIISPDGDHEPNRGWYYHSVLRGHRHQSDGGSALKAHVPP